MVPKSGEAFSIAGVMYAIEEVRDDDGRPLNEGRAPLVEREGVPMEKRRCPYGDERLGRWMNVSALAQITSRLDAALDDIRAFRTHQRHPETWEGFCEAVMDRMVAPTVHLLRTKAATVTVHDAVGYKFAAGYHKPAREALLLEAAGTPLDFSVEGLHRHVRARRSLVGAREVCAAPNPMLDRVTAVFLCPPAGAPDPGISSRRVFIAERLTQQLRLGQCWEAYDANSERRLLLEGAGLAGLEGRTPYLRRTLAERASQLAQCEAWSPLGSIPRSLSSADRHIIASLLAGDRAVSDNEGEMARAFASAEAMGEGTIRITDAALKREVGVLFASYLRTYMTIASVHVRLELELRDAISPGLSGAVKLTGGMLPRPRCLGWFEQMSGHRLNIDTAPLHDLVLVSTNRRLGLPAGAWEDACRFGQRGPAPS